MKFHLTDDGAKPCSAKPGNCPITKETGGEHYSSINEAEKSYEQSQSAFVKPKKVGLPKTKITSTLIPKKGGSYYGLIIEHSDVQAHLKEWYKEVGADNAASMEQAKIQRDGAYEFHATLIKPNETRQLKKKGFKINLKDYNLNFTGIGSATDGEKEAWFITAESKEIEKMRSELELPKHDLHVTIGFKTGDVHTKPKGNNSIRLV